MAVFNHLRRVLLVGCLLCCVSHVPGLPRRGTTKHIQQVFEGRCWDYYETKYVDVLPRVERDCGQLWRLFSQAFIYNDPCNVSIEDYGPFLDATKQITPRGKSMFWSRVFSLAHRYNKQGRRYVTLEDTLPGYLANNITWCGQWTQPGINYTSCPGWRDCQLQAECSFWIAAAIRFAQAARGNAVVLLDGSNPHRPAYSNQSIFGKYEVPNMRQVGYLSVIVSHRLDMPKIERCGEGSLKHLEADVRKQGIGYLCFDDPRPVIYLLCSDSPASRECDMLHQHREGRLSLHH